MQAAATIKDRYGLAMTTSSAKAADHYVEGLDLFLEQGFGPEAQFQMAIEADEGFTLAHAGLSLVQMLKGSVAEARAESSRAATLALSATRREQQQAEAMMLLTLM